MIIKLTVLGLLSNLVSASHCSGHPSPDATRNLNEIWADEPQFVRRIQDDIHGEAALYHAGNDTLGNVISVVHLWPKSDILNGLGSYSRGFLHGKLMHEEAVGLINGAWDYFEEQFEQAINGTVPAWIPEWAIDFIAKFGMEEGFDITWEITKKYTGQYFVNEMEGLADATGVPYSKIRRFHMIGELTKGSCSMYGAWDKATLGSKTLQLRALDWNVDGPFQKWPQVTVYHTNSDSNANGTGPSTPSTMGYAFANVGWTGWLGSITGMSERRTAISEIGVSFPDETFGKESRFGVPFTFLLRDILQFDATLSEAMAHISGSHRTCDLILGVGDGKMNTSDHLSVPFRGIQYSHSVANFFTDKNMMPKNDTWHARLDQIVYYGMDWLCPGYSQVLHAQLDKFHGTLTPENTISDVVAITQTGDLHVAVYDLTDNLMYVSNAKKDDSTPGPKLAYDRQFVKFDMTSLFSLKPENPTQIDLIQ